MKWQWLGRLLATVMATTVSLGLLPLTATAADMTAPSDGNFSFLWVSDPQIYTNEYRHILSAQNDWILDNANRLNVKYAFHTGDLVHVYNDTSQWEFVSEEYKKWDDAGFSYGVLAGNHDMSGTDYSLYSQYFGKSRYEGNWWYGGDYNNNYGHYDLRSTGGANFIFVYLSYGDHTQADYDWVNGVLQEHSNRIAVLLVHDYMATTGGRSERGEIIFNEVVRKNPNVRMVLCGHNYNSNRTVDEIDDNGDGKADRTVYQIMANYQYTTAGGNGFIRFMECDVQNGIITHRTYSPYTESFGSDYEDGLVIDQYGRRDAFVTPFDFSDPVAKAVGDPEYGTVVYTSEISFAPTDSYTTVTLPVVYENAAESGTIYRGIGVYDSAFSLDAADAFSDPTALNYVVTNYTKRTGHTVAKVIRGSSLSGGKVQVPIPQSGAVVALPADAPVNLDELTVGRRVTLDKMRTLSLPTPDYATNVTVPSWGGIYNYTGINRVGGNGEWVVYDALNTATDAHTWDMLFSFAPVSGSTYRLTAADTALGTDKAMTVPSGGFVLAVNAVDSVPMWQQAMRDAFTTGLQVTLNGHTPGNAPSYATTNLLAPSVSAWTKDSTMVITKSGNTQTFYNTDGQWPDAEYTYPSALTVNPASTVLAYDYMSEVGARTNISLLFNSTDGEQVLTIHPYFDGVELSTKSGDAKGDNVRRAGKIDFTDMDIPSSCYRADGTLAIKGIRIYASGEANTDLNIYTLALTTDRSVDDDAIARSVTLLSDALTVTTPDRAGYYHYDNGSLTVVSDAADGYEVEVMLNRSFCVGELKNWILDVEATTPFDIQLHVTTAADDASYGLVSDLYPFICEATDGNYIPAAAYRAALDLKSCFTYNNVLPADGNTTVKKAVIRLAGQGTLAIHALQASNIEQAVAFADGIVADYETPYVLPGDVSGDKIVTTTDARIAMLHALESHTLEGNAFLAADFNTDGEVTTLDARLIMLYALTH